MKTELSSALVRINAITPNLKNEIPKPHELRISSLVLPSYVPPDGNVLQARGRATGGHIKHN